VLVCGRGGVYPSNGLTISGAGYYRANGMALCVVVTETGVGCGPRREGQPTQSINCEAISGLDNHKPLGAE